MSVSSVQYVPVLKWRMAEYQALYRLRDEEKPRVVPLLVIPPVEYDFEAKRPRKSLQEHIDGFLTRYPEKWANRPAFVDLHPSLLSDTLDTGESTTTYLFRILREQQCSALPVIGPVTATWNQLCAVAAQDGRGAALRLSLMQLASGSLPAIIQTLASEFSIHRADIDLIVDLGLPENYVPIDAFASALSMHYEAIEALDRFRSFVQVGTSIRLQTIDRPGGFLSRREWELYRAMIQPECRLQRIPSYGDYTIETPDFAPDLDFRKISPAGKIVYTIPDQWMVAKGQAMKINRSQMQDLSAQIINSEHYLGPDFCFGDHRLHQVAVGSQKPGNLTMMKQVGINHHLTYVLRDLARIHVPRNTA